MATSQNKTEGWRWCGSGSEQLIRLEQQTTRVDSGQKNRSGSKAIAGIPLGVKQIVSGLVTMEIPLSFSSAVIPK